MFVVAGMVMGMFVDMIMGVRMIVAVRMVMAVAAVPGRFAGVFGGKNILS